MPLTRARQQAAPASTSENGFSTLDSETDIQASKHRLTRSATQQPFLRSIVGRISQGLNVPNALSKSDSQDDAAKPTFKRTVSSPALNASNRAEGPALMSPSSSSNGHQPARSPPTSSSSCGVSSTRNRTTFTRRQSVSSRSRRTSSANDSDSSDDESSPHSSRLGGCSVDQEPPVIRDDSNKENVAPRRRVSEAVLLSEARDAESETAARRTRSRGSITPRRPSVSGSSVASSVASSIRSRSRGSMVRSQTDMGPRTTPMTRVSSRASEMSSVASTPTSRKRPRGSRAANPGEDQESTPGSPMSRLRLDGSGSSSAMDDSESYFSSQRSLSTAQSSVFDAQSRCGSDDFAGGASRATTPDAAENVSLDSKEADITQSPIEVGYSNVYAHARALLRYAAGTAVDTAEAEDNSTSNDGESSQNIEVDVVGRNQERNALHGFMSKRFGIFSSQSACTDLEELLDGNVDSGSLYICGLPGTGKTALVRSVLKDVLDLARAGQQPPRVAFVNCMAVDNPRQIFARVLTALGETVKGASEAHSEAEAERKMDKIISGSAHKTLIVLDEIDHLLHSRAHQNVLYRLFAWASDNPACALIGIANSLDLTERFVPLLASKGAAPALLHFRPFDSKEIVEVLRSRLGGLQSRYDGLEEDAAMTEAGSSSVSSGVFSPPALELLSKKIAAATGDLRKALDAARLAVELVEGEQRKQALANCTASGTGTPTEASKLLSHLTPTSAPKITPAHILKVMTAVLGSPHLTKLRQLSLQPKLILAALVIAHKRASENMPILGAAGKKKAPGALNINDIQSTYHAMLSNDGNFNTLENSEVLAVFELLEVQGVISLSTDAAELGSSQSTSTSSLSSGNSSSGFSSPTSGVSPGGKRAAKKQLLASERLVRLLFPMEDVQKGITTVASALALSTNTEGLPSQGIADSIRRLMLAEEERIRKNRGWDTVMKEREEVRMEELGGGRMSFGI